MGISRAAALASAFVKPLRLRAEWVDLGWCPRPDSNQHGLAANRTFSCRSAASSCCSCLVAATASAALDSSSRRPRAAVSASFSSMNEFGRALVGGRCRRGVGRLLSLFFRSGRLLDQGRPGELRVCRGERHRSKLDGTSDPEECGQRRTPPGSGKSLSARTTSRHFQPPRRLVPRAAFMGTSVSDAPIASRLIIQNTDHLRRSYRSLRGVSGTRH